MPYYQTSNHSMERFMDRSPNSSGTPSQAHGFSDNVLGPILVDSVATDESHGSVHHQFYISIDADPQHYLFSTCGDLDGFEDDVLDFIAYHRLGEALIRPIRQVIRNLVTGLEQNLSHRLSFYHVPMINIRRTSQDHLEDQTICFGFRSASDAALLQVSCSNRDDFYSVVKTAIAEQSIDEALCLPISRFIESAMAGVMSTSNHKLSFGCPWQKSALEAQIFSTDAYQLVYLSQSPIKMIGRNEHDEGAAQFNELITSATFHDFVNREADRVVLATIITCANIMDCHYSHCRCSSYVTGQLGRVQSLIMNNSMRPTSGSQGNPQDRVIWIFRYLRCWLESTRRSEKVVVQRLFCHYGALQAAHCMYRGIGSSGSSSPDDAEIEAWVQTIIMPLYEYHCAMLCHYLSTLFAMIPETWPSTRRSRRL